MNLTIAPRIGRYKAIPVNAAQGSMLEQINAIEFDAISIGSESGQFCLVPLDESCVDNAERIVACVKACDGIPTKSLLATIDDADDLGGLDLVSYALIERVGLRGERDLAVQQCEYLLAAMIQAKELIESVVPFEGDIMRQINAAIAKAEAKL